MCIRDSHKIEYVSILSCRQYFKCGLVTFANNDISPSSIFELRHSHRDTSRRRVIASTKAFVFLPKGDWRTPRRCMKQPHVGAQPLLRCFGCLHHRRFQIAVIFSYYPRKVVAICTSTVRVVANTSVNSEYRVTDYPVFIPLILESGDLH